MLRLHVHSEVTLNHLTNKTSSHRNILLERQAARTGSPLQAAERNETEKKPSAPSLLEKLATPPPAAKPVKKKRKKKNSVTANLGGTRYEVSK